jgi:phage I-like protein
MSESTATLNRVILSLPSLVSLATTKADMADAPRSWIQLAKTGTFHSSRYGTFSITRDDLSQMLHNFRNVTPAAPTELPIDYDHLSMDPKQPGDGKAAGWLKHVELRAEGEELWGEVEWTPDAADLIQNRAYRFVSPSFVKDHTHKDGRKIGTTLLAAAITNHPFLEGMQALTLYSFSAMGDLALVETPTTAAAVHLAELGQRVTFKPDAERTPELTDDERRQTFIVKATVGGGDDQFVRLATRDGREFGWFRASAQLAPAPATENTTMQDTKSTETDLEQKAAAFAARVAELSKSCVLRDAISLATAQDPEGASAYRLVGIGAEPAEAVPAPAPINLSVREGETFDALAMRYAHEHGVSLRQAVHAVSKARPDLAAARG